jgi:hypothetical protein
MFIPMLTLASRRAQVSVGVCRENISHKSNAAAAWSLVAKFVECVHSKMNCVTLLLTWADRGRICDVD